MSESLITKGSGNVFLDLGFEHQEAQNLLLRSRAIAAIVNWHKDSDLTQAQAAKKLGLTQPRFNQLLKGKIAEFSLDALVNTAAAAGLQITFNIAAPKKPKDATRSDLRAKRAASKKLAKAA